MRQSIRVDETPSNVAEMDSLHGSCNTLTLVPHHSVARFGQRSGDGREHFRRGGYENSDGMRLRRFSEASFLARRLEEDPKAMQRPVPVRRVQVEVGRQGSVARHERVREPVADAADHGIDQPGDPLGVRGVTSHRVMQLRACLLSVEGPSCEAS